MLDKREPMVEEEHAIYAPSHPTPCILIANLQWKICSGDGRSALHGIIIERCVHPLPHVECNHFIINWRASCTVVNVTSRVVSNRETTTSIILDESEPFQEAFNMCLILGRVNSKSYYPPAALTKLPIPFKVQLKRVKTTPTLARQSKPG